MDPPPGTGGSSSGRRRTSRSRGHRNLPTDEDMEGEDIDDDDDDGDGKPKFSRAELRSISEILEGSEFGKRFSTEQAEQKEKISRMRQHLESDIGEMVAQLTGMVRQIRLKEHEINGRIAKLAERLSVEIIQPLEEEHRDAGRVWVYPFLLMMATIAGAASYGYSKYKSFMKTHLL